MKSMLLICYRPPPLWARALAEGPFAGTLCAALMACAFSQVKVEKYTHGQRGSPKTGPLLACEYRNGGMAHSARDLRRDCYAAVDIG
ncbi:hypothetical protein, partial [Adlercreutzia sp. DFI.6.23]|uniref:hypothetical protein n=1 Tax=Adlercreutzia sp. DFI.6.23 TaxID=2963705 RepID=UPI00210A2D3D